MPNGVWPSAYDGGYLFADGGIGKIFLRNAAGSGRLQRPRSPPVSASSPTWRSSPRATATRSYYTDNASSALRKITYTGGPPVPSVGGLRLTPIAPKRVYDTRNGIGTTAGLVARRPHVSIDVSDPDADVKAVLANITFAEAEAPGFGQAWPTRLSVRPPR